MERLRRLGVLALTLTSLSIFAEECIPQITENGELLRPAVNPEAYRTFNERGRWPDGTVFVLEIRNSEQSISIDAGGCTQGALVMLEASAKDSFRFPEGGWGYFMFGDGRESAAPLPPSASCYSCHAEHGAVEWTFTQFYADLFEVARNLGTVRDDYDPARKVEPSSGE